jgi:16S rRNA (uracil1498-N3)-methyltransferase
MKNGDQVIVLDGQGFEYLVSISIDFDRMYVEGEILKRSLAEAEPKTEISLCFGLSNREKTEFILQKGTEIGVSVFFPFVSSRTLIKTASLEKKRIQRWERIIQEAAEQSRRGRCPILNQILSLKACCEEVVPTHQLSLAAWENEAPSQTTLSNLLDGFDSRAIALFIGPEGGFSENEIEHLVSAGAHSISLGKRILRMETAALIFPALVLYELEDM